MRPEPHWALSLYFLGIILGAISLFRIKPSRKRFFFFLIFFTLINGYGLGMSIAGEPDKLSENIFMAGHGIAFCYVATFYRQILIKATFPLLFSLTIGYWLLISSKLDTMEKNGFIALTILGIIGTLLFIFSILQKKLLKNWNKFLLYTWMTFTQAVFAILYYSRLEQDAVRYVPAPPIPGVTILPGGGLYFMEFTGHSLIGMFLFGIILITTYTIIVSFIVSIIHFVIPYKGQPIAYNIYYQGSYAKFWENAFKPFKSEDFFDESFSLKREWFFILIIQVASFAILYNINELFGFYTLAVFAILGPIIYQRFLLFRKNTLRE